MLTLLIITIILILNLEDDDEPLIDEAKYQEHMAEVINNQRELENSQK